MKLSGYNVTLTRLTEDKLELVRNWRNDPKIVQFVAQKEFITPEMQRKWFQKINNENNYIFIIEFEGKEIGQISIKDIDYQTKEGEGGFYIFDDAYLNSDIAFRAALCIQDFHFDTLKLDRMIIHILNENKRSIRFNKYLGYKIAENQEGNDNPLYILTAEEHYKNKEKILKLLLKAYPS